jgi:hypothetical protein
MAAEGAAKRFAIAAAILLAAGPFLPKWLAYIITISLAYGLVVAGVVVLMRAGLVSFGQGLYFCLGGYAAGIAGKHFGVSDAFLLLVLAVALSVAVAALLGVLLARYREIFFAMLTTAFSMTYGLLSRTQALDRRTASTSRRRRSRTPGTEARRPGSTLSVCLPSAAPSLSTATCARAGHAGDAIRKTRSVSVPGRFGLPGRLSQVRAARRWAAWAAGSPVSPLPRRAGHGVLTVRRVRVRRAARRHRVHPRRRSPQASCSNDQTAFEHSPYTWQRCWASSCSRSSSSPKGLWSLVARARVADERSPRSRRASKSFGGDRGSDINLTVATRGRRRDRYNGAGRRRSSGHRYLAQRGRSCSGPRHHGLPAREVGAQACAVRSGTQRPRAHRAGEHADAWACCERR